MTYCLLLLAENTKNEPFFDILMTITPAGSKINRLNEFMFFIYSLNSVGMFNYYISRPSIFSSKQYTKQYNNKNRDVHGKDDTFKTVNKDIFFCIKFPNV